MITFGRFGHIEDINKEKALFLKILNDLISELRGDFTGTQQYKDESEIINPLKDLLKKNIKKSFFLLGSTISFSCFLEYMGLSYYTLTQNELDDILIMDFTYENWKKKSLILINNFTERIKKEFPPETLFCFDDIYFVFHIKLYGDRYKYNNYFNFIRDYFILEETSYYIKEYRDSKKYNEIKKKVINIYPKIKEKYGMNRILEKFLSFIFLDNDQNYEKTRNILDNYYNKKKGNKIDDDESIKLKDKQD